MSLPWHPFFSCWNQGISSLHLIYGFLQLCSGSSFFLFQFLRRICHTKHFPLYLSIIRSHLSCHHCPLHQIQTPHFQDPQSFGASLITRFPCSTRNCCSLTLPLPIISSRYSHEESSPFYHTLSEFYSCSSHCFPKIFPNVGLKISLVSRMCSIQINVESRSVF